MDFSIEGIISLICCSAIQDNPRVIDSVLEYP